MWNICIIELLNIKFNVLLEICYKKYKIRKLKPSKYIIYEFTGLMQKI